MASAGLVTDPCPVSVPDEDATDSPEDSRLWIGNLDQRITEYSLLKILQRYGELKKFDFLLVTTGPDTGKPRGYCFVSYKDRKDAEKAIKGLNGKLALSKRMLVKWAHIERQEKDRPVNKTAPSSVPQLNISPESKIKAIEAKLKAMEEKAVEYSPHPVAPPGSSRLCAANIEAQQNSIRSQNNPKYNRSRRPYNNRRSNHRR